MAKMTALVWDGRKAYFFGGNKYLRYDIQADRADAGYPQLISSAWKGVFDRDIDAAAVWPNKKAYFFRGAEYIRYDIAADRADAGYPSPISAGWTGVFDRNLNAAVVWPNGKAYFFRGSEYIRFDIAADRADAGYPKPISSGWAGVFDTGIDAAVVWPGNKAYFFRGSEYIRYDIAADKADAGYPKPITSGWTGVVLSPGTDVTPTPQPGPDGNDAAFEFQLIGGEAIGDRIVRCCEEALHDGPIGNKNRHDFYREFISCKQEVSRQKAEALTTVATSCAMFVRAVREWSGAAPVGPYVPGTPMFKSMGNVSFSHPAFVANQSSAEPNPGDYFYISTTRQSNDGHTGIFIEPLGDGAWRTAEGGGGGVGDGTQCSFRQRRIVGGRFDTDARSLWGWFDCTKVGLPIA
jgi:hemopexin